MENEVEFKKVGDMTVFSNGDIYYKGEKKEPKIKRWGKDRVRLYVYLCYKPRKINICIHPLVATLFCYNPNSYKHIIFKDGNSLNVNADNLEWVPYDKSLSCQNSGDHRRIIRNITIEQTLVSDKFKKAIKEENFKKIISYLTPFKIHIDFPFYKSTVYDIVKDMNARGKGLLENTNDKMLVKYINTCVIFRWKDYQRKLNEVYIDNKRY